MPQPCARALLALWLSWVPVAPATAGDTESVLLAPITVSGTQQPDIHETETATVSTIDAQEISERQVRDIKDLVRYEPGVSVTGNPSRFGLSGFNIRGLDDNYVVMSIDGIRLPDAFRIGGYSSTGRNMVDVGLVAGIDIVRGTGSSVHGVDALGGVAAFRALRPEDLLQGRSSAASIESIYAEANRSRSWLAAAAAGNDTIALLAKGVVRRGHETKTTGTVGGAGGFRTLANPQDLASDAWLMHATIRPAPGHRSDVTIEQFVRDVDTDDLSQIKVASEDAMRTYDSYRRWRASLDHQMDNLPIGAVRLKLYRQDSTVSQFSVTRLKDLGLLNNPADVTGDVNDPDRWLERLSTFRQDSRGVRLDIASIWSALGRHSTDWGSEYVWTETAQFRDGYTESVSGQRARFVTPLAYPARDFPLSKTRRAGLYALDHWQVASGWTVVSGLRFDHYRLGIAEDAVFSANPFGASSGDVSMGRVVPRIGVIHDLGHGLSLSAQYAHGFRPPPYESANTAFANPNQGVAYVPNPDLAAETSRGVELSLRHADAAGNWSLTVYDNRYRDFVDSDLTVLSGGLCPGHPLCREKPRSYWIGGVIPTYYSSVYQTVNLARVRMHGFEAKLTREILRGWRIRAALSHSRGYDQQTGESVCRINPPSGVLGLSHERGAWRTDLVVTGALGKRGKDARQIVSDGVGPATTVYDCGRQFMPPGYQVVDLFLHWQFARGGRVTLGINNLFDKTYRLWADSPVCDPHVADSCGGIDRYAQPGRNVSVSFVPAF
ncbi:MAG: TonB-dependent receptor [Methyloversatilis sp.]|uniref:TonB-dependent receptor domain-containing protein n=1 Tax=Methyloversatilis sp. TaxID=2569862 RepID=UPI0025D9FB60|nr:TonB-dependent receptor [Methyloversatilis sp.]MCR6665289.1 TonB-dependent receptor [Methyloversatilis sp.]